ncbi:hypothetical protein [Rhizobium sp. LjRoot258]|uniref:hypothetical protein n=1 Tax=Rhizobium sp. LjRoot258 TaxID=3342299 RepID=UPI003ECCAA48
MLALFCWGTLGGVLIELVHWYNLRTNQNFPAYAKSPLYWLTGAAMALAGGLVAVLFLGSTGDPKDAVGLGLAAPAVLQKLIAGGLTLADRTGAQGDAKGTELKRGSASADIKDFLIG